MSRACGFLAGLALVLALAGCASAPGTPDLPPGEPVELNNPSFAPDAQGQLTGWNALEHNAGKSYSFVADRQAPRSAPASARINRHGPEFFGVLEQRVRIKPEWVGKTARLSGYIKTAGATGTGGALVLQARSGGDGILAHDHMDDRRVRGDQDWRRYTAQVKITPGTWWLQVGVMLQDDGTLWADDLALHILP